ncbi:metalloregulator ArsR/SmtB family transcription factor [Streptomyces sp. NPDC005329]|uniref:ArsR/SmtB family transcription factor n=1 Tax=Streptomyces sp. NPDC005329 TaxID=3157034 RepID=UPI0033BE25B5
MIASRSGGEVCVCDLTPAFNLSQPTISHHLKLLRQAGLIDCERTGSSPTRPARGWPRSARSATRSRSASAAWSTRSPRWSTMSAADGIRVAEIVQPKRVSHGTSSGSDPGDRSDLNSVGLGCFHRGSPLFPARSGACVVWSPWFSVGGFGPYRSGKPGWPRRGGQGRAGRRTAEVTIDAGTALGLV